MMMMMMNYWNEWNEGLERTCLLDSVLDSLSIDENHAQKKKQSEYKGMDWFREEEKAIRIRGH